MLVLGLTLFYGSILFAVWCLLSQCKTRSYMDHLAKLSDAELSELHQFRDVKHRAIIEREGARRQVAARKARAKRRLSRQLEMD